MHSINYPENCIRGISSKDSVCEGTATPFIFGFRKEHKRPDGRIAESINWEDDDSVVEFTLQQKKPNGDIQFKVGVARIPRYKIDALKKSPIAKIGRLSYERQNMPENKFHGNILVNADSPKIVKRTIAAGLALAVSEVIFQPNADDII